MEAGLLANTKVTYEQMQVDKIEADAQRQIEEAVTTVKAAPLLAPEVALQDLYA